MGSLTLSDYKKRLSWIKSTLEKEEEDCYGRFMYSVPLACYSDYSGGMVERCNSAYLDGKYSFETMGTGETLYIKVTET